MSYITFQPDNDDIYKINTSLNTACSSRVFSEAEETATVEAVSEDDSQEERERKERIPQRKADISRCWSKYCLDVLRTSRDRCVQELTSADQNDEEQKTEKGWESCFYYINLEFNSLNLKVQGKFLMVNKPCEVIINK